MKLYFAGPLFTSAERTWNDDLATALRDAGHEVFLPQDKEPGKDAPGMMFSWKSLVVVPLKAEQETSVRAVSAVNVTGSQPDVMNVDSGSLTSQVIEPALLNQPLSPSVPVMCGVIVGEVGSLTVYRSTYRESIDGLLEGGVDLFWFETFSLIDLQSSWFGVRSVAPSAPAGSLRGSRSRSQPDPDVRA